MMKGGRIWRLLPLSFAGHAASGTARDFFAPLASGTFAGAILFLGIASSLVTALTSNYILSKLTASKMSAFTNLSTIMSIAAEAVFLGEDVHLYHLIGSALIIAGVIGANRFGHKR